MPPLVSGVVDWLERNWRNAGVFLALASGFGLASIWIYRRVSIKSPVDWTTDEISTGANVVMALAAVVGVYGLLRWRSQHRQALGGQSVHDLAKDLALFLPRFTEEWESCFERFVREGAERASPETVDEDYASLIAVRKDLSQLSARMDALCDPRVARPLRKVRDTIDEQLRAVARIRAQRMEYRAPGMLLRRSEIFQAHRCAEELAELLQEWCAFQLGASTKELDANDVDERSFRATFRRDWFTDKHREWAERDAIKRPQQEAADAAAEQTPAADAVEPEPAKE